VPVCLISERIIATRMHSPTATLLAAPPLTNQLGALLPLPLLDPHPTPPAAARILSCRGTPRTLVPGRGGAKMDGTGEEVNDLPPHRCVVHSAASQIAPTKLLKRQELVCCASVPVLTLPA